MKIEELKKNAIDLNTVLSQFDEKGTLLKWLKSLEAHLFETEIEEVELILDDNQLKVKVLQGDVEHVSDAITLPEGLTLEKLAALLEGSEYISVDVNEAGTKLVIELDETNVTDQLVSGSTALITSGGVYTPFALLDDRVEAIEGDVETKLDASKSAVASVGGLVTPTAAPTEKVLVGVGTGNEQVQVKIGENLELSGVTSPYTLKATGGGGGDSKVKIYKVTGFAAQGATLTLPTGVTGNTLRSDFRAGNVVILSNDAGLQNNDIKNEAVPNDVDYDVWVIYYINSSGGVSVMNLRPTQTERYYAIFGGSSNSATVQKSSN